MAPTIQHILQNSVSHPEVEQHKVQVLIWALLAHAKISDSSPEIQQTARTLMTKDEIDMANGGAIGKIPPEVLNRAMRNLPPEAQQVMRAEDSIRGMLAGAANVPYAQLERVAVLEGNIAPPKGSRDVPEGRWSYHPDGFFMRFFPKGYPTTRTMYYSPEQFKLETDAQGRITAVEDPQGVRVETKFDDRPGPLTFAGDTATKGYALASIRISGPDPAKPGEKKGVVVEGSGWVMVGAPNGKGRAGAAGGAFAGAQDRYSWAVEHLQKLATLNSVIRSPQPGRTAPAPGNLEKLVDLASYAQGLKLAVSGKGADTKWATEQLGVIYRAWMSAVVMQGEVPQRAERETLQASAQRFRFADIVSKTLLPRFPRLGFAAQYGAFNQGQVSPMTPVPRGPRPGTPGFNPSGGTAAPGNTGKQRLAQSGAKAGEGNGNDLASKAKDANSALATGTSAVEWGHVLITEGSPWGFPPYEIPLQLAERMIDRIMDLWNEASNALFGDPPRNDYRQMATAEKPKLPLVTGGGKVSQKRVDAFNAYLDAALDLAVKLHAMTLSRDRYSGAMKAGDNDAAYRQLSNMGKWQRESGFAMLIAADKLEALIKVLRDEGFKFPEVTPAMVKAYQDNLRVKGFSPQDIAAAKSLGMTDEEIEEARQSRLQPVDDRALGRLDVMEENVVQSFRDLGNVMTLVPAAEVKGG